MNAAYGLFVWLCIRPGIQEQGTECRKCGEWREYYKWCIYYWAKVLFKKWKKWTASSHKDSVFSCLLFLGTKISKICLRHEKNQPKKTCCFLLLRSVTFTEAVTEVFYLKAVLKHSAIFTGQQLCWGLFLIKYQTRSPATLLKKLQHGCFPVNIATFLIKRIWVGSTNSCSIKIFSEQV